MSLEVYLLARWADDYHGGFQILGIFASEELARNEIPKKHSLLSGQS